MRNWPIPISSNEVGDFRRRWRITELALFGSVLRSDFGANSDIDVLLSFADEASWTLFDLVRMKEELSGILGRQVDLVTRRGIEASRNYIRRREILSSAEVVHGAG